MNMVTRTPDDRIEGVTVNSARRVVVEYGKVYDVQTESYVPGMVIKVGLMEVAVTEAQAERIAEEIDGKIMSDDLEDKIRRALDRHPAGRGLL